MLPARLKQINGKTIIRTPFSTLILTTHDIFCLGFDRDPEGWVAPGHQIDINDNEP